MGVLAAATCRDRLVKRYCYELCILGVLLGLHYKTARFDVSYGKGRLEKSRTVSG